MSSLPRVVFVAPAWPPSNLTCAHRSRLFVGHLREFGYEPVVLTVDPRFYEERPDPDLERLVAPDLEVIRTPALPTRPRIIGDLGVRSLAYHYGALARLAEARAIDLLFLPVPPHYSCLLGPLIKRRYRVPYVIDYIDPWVYPITDEEKRTLKGRISHSLGALLEPFALSDVDGLSAVAESYLTGVLERHPRLKDVPRLGVPYGAEPADDAFVDRSGRASTLLARPELVGKKVFVYAGAFLPRARETFRALFEGLRDLSDDSLRLLFFGTVSGGAIAQLAAAAGVSDRVVEIGERQSYLETLATLRRAHGILVLGSAEPHYTPSKLYQALLSGRPVLCALHRASPALDLARSMAGVEIIAFQPTADGRQREFAAALRALAEVPANRPIPRDLAPLERFSARAGTEQLARFFDVVLQRSPYRVRLRAG